MNSCYARGVRKNVWQVILVLLGVAACAPPELPIPANKLPTISQLATLSVNHNTLAEPEQQTLSFTVSDVEDKSSALTVTAKANDIRLVTLTQPSCDEIGQCTFNLTVKRTEVATTSVHLSVKDSKGGEAKNSFEVVIAPEDKTVTNGTELKTLLESATPGQSLRLTSTQPILLDTQILPDKELTLWGLGQDKTILDAQNLDRLFWIKATGKVILQDLTLTNGKAKDDGSTLQDEPLGGAIFNEGLLTLERVRIINSSAVSGGGVYNFGPGHIVIKESVIGQENARNIATRSGGGVFNNAGRVEIDHSQVSFNQGDERGGGLYNLNAGELLVQSSTLFNNFSWDGTAIKNEEATTIIRRSTLEQNVATRLEGGAIVNLRGRLELYDSVLKNNETLLGSGGAIYNGATSTMLIDHTELRGNKAARVGGAIYNEIGSGLLELRNGSKIIGNSASENGGGILNAGTLKISDDCQIITNTANTLQQTFSGGGIFNIGTFVDTSEQTLSQVVTNNQPDNIATPSPAMMALYRALYQLRLVNKANELLR
jgi:hypothetical protein